MSQGSPCYIALMPELLRQTSPEHAILPLVIDGELTDHLDPQEPVEESPILAAENPATLAVAETVDVDFTPSPSEKPTIRDRIFRHVGRIAAVAAAGLSFAFGSSAVDAGPAEASSDKVYTTTDNVYLHSDPGLGDNGDLVKLMPKGTKFTADCYVNDTPIGEKNNPAWLHGTDETGATGYFTDAYSDSHWDRNNTLHDQGLAFCGEEKAPAENQKTTSGHDLQPAESIPIFTEYDRDAAASWARNHAKDTPPNAGSCTWFVSNALWKGGVNETPEWNNNLRGVKREGILRYGTDIAWGASEFMNYAETLPYVEIHRVGQIDGQEKLPEAKLGDIIMYDWDGHGVVDHATIVTGFSKNNPQYPLVSGWSENEGKALWYSQRGWTWSEKSNQWIGVVEPDTKVRLLHIRTEDEAIN